MDGVDDAELSRRHDVNSVTVLFDRSLCFPVEWRVFNLKAQCYVYKARFFLFLLN